MPDDSDNATRLVAGAMTGTSLDAIDAALVRVTGEGLSMKVELVRASHEPLRELRALLRPIVRQRRRPIGDAARYANMLGISHAMAFRDLAAGDPLDFVVVHGQTVYHEAGVSLQMINPHPIAAELGVPVAFDLRGADIAAGGEGAPITPLADHVLFRSADETRVVVNLGGFANYTWLPATVRTDVSALDTIRGGDVCAGNQLLDYVARRWLKKRYDKDGRAAARGIVHPEAAQMLEMMLDAQADGGRSLGTGDEEIAMNWAKMFQHHCTGEDLAATACSVIGSIIAGACGEADRIVLAGGGARNLTLVDAIRAAVREAAGRDKPVVLSDELGVPVESREAIAMAVLGAAARDGLPITLPQVTGRDPDASPQPCWAYP